MLQAEQVAMAADARKTRTVAICGTAGSSREEIMQQPPEVELWGLNLAYKWMPRWDRWFEMHDPAIFRGVFIESHWEWLKTCGIPVYMQMKRDDVPTSVTFPVDEVTGHGALHPYFTSSIAYMLALAIHEGVGEIRLLGANMATGSEYAYQRAGVEYWIAVAEARGIKVHLPPSSPLLKGPHYGAVGASADLVRGIIDTREAVKLQIEQTYQMFIEQQKKSLDEVEKTVMACMGAMQALDKLTEGQSALSQDQSGLVAVEPTQ